MKQLQISTVSTMINNNLPLQLAKAFAAESASTNRYVNIGDGIIPETRGDSTLGNELAITIPSITVESGVVELITDFSGADILLNGETVYESGITDAASSGKLLERSSRTTGILMDDNKNIKVVKLVAASGNNTDKRVVPEESLDLVSGWIGGTSITAPTHIAFGTRLILDQADDLGVNPNDWKDSTDATTAALNQDNFQEGIASIKMGKSGVASASFSYERTLATPINATNATVLQIDINALDPTDYDKLKTAGALKLQIGNDNSNYFEETFSKADVIIGWQRMEITISDMAETGSVTTSSMDYLRIVWETTNASDTITSGSLLMDYWALTIPFTASDQTMIQEIHREAVTSSSTKETSRATHRTVVDKTDGNTYLYNYVSLFNDASAGIMFYEEFFIDTTKDDKTQITAEANVQFSIRR